MNTIIAVAILVFGLLMAVEYAYGLAVGRNTYRLNDSISSLSQGVLSQIVSGFTQLFLVGIYAMVFSSIALFPHEEFWNRWYGWLIAVIMFDFCDYWLHRFSHETAILWAAHAVHHQSQEFNFSTALRQESLYSQVGFMFYLPMAILGVPPLNFALAGVVVLFYQFWIHTQHIGKLGWFDRIFSSPSNHRVHHAINDQYVDKNYGAIFVIWDRMFGTYAEEKGPCIYGIKQPLNSWDPLWAVTGVYWELVRRTRQTRRWFDKLRIWFMPPGWRPVDTSTLHPTTALDVQHFGLFDPRMTERVKWFSGVHFFLLLVAFAVYLWNENALSSTVSSAFAIQMIVGLCVVGAVMQGRMTITKGLVIEAVTLMGLTIALSYLQHGLIAH